MRVAVMRHADLDATLRRRHGHVADAADDAHAFALQEGTDRGGDLRVLARHKSRRAFQHGDLGAEAAEDLREFQSDIAAAEDDEVLRNNLQRERGGVGEVRHAVDAGNRAAPQPCRRH